MSHQIVLSKGKAILDEIQEFGCFAYETQRYMCRSLHVAFRPAQTAVEWARDEAEANTIGAQERLYKTLPLIRSSVPRRDGFVDANSFLFPLIGVTAFDLSGRCIHSFAEYRFLYERLIGAAARPWLASVFAAASALPCLGAEERRALLESIGGAFTANWSATDPTFFPDFLAG